jgi:hypothetical protein
LSAEALRLLAAKITNGGKESAAPAARLLDYKIIYRQSTAQPAELETRTHPLSK